MNIECDGKSESSNEDGARLHTSDLTILTKYLNDTVNVSETMDGCQLCDGPIPNVEHEFVS